MNSKEIKDLAASVIMNTYGRYDLALTQGRGTRLFDPEGREYLDFVSGLAVTSLGHGHEELAEVLADQARRLIHVSNLYYTEPQVKLARLLVENSFADQVFFANSGAEANEAAIKLARKYSFDKYGEGRYKVLTIDKSFHGRTMLTLAATAQPDKHVGFAPLPEGFSYLPLGDLAALEEALDTGGVAAVMIEPIQGEGGVNTAGGEYLAQMKKLCLAHDALLIFDEIQVGMGRTGRLFAHEHYGVTPDIMTLAKALANGLPIGACLARREVAAAFGPGAHATTFGGTPLVCAAAVWVMEKMLAPGFMEKVAATGAYLESRLTELASRHAFIRRVKGLGLILAIEVDFPGADIVRLMQEKGFLINCIQGNILRFLPSLVIERPEIDRMIEALEASLLEVTTQKQD